MAIFWVPRMQIDLTPEQVYSIVVSELKLHSTSIKRECRLISGKKKAKDYEKQDLERLREVLAAIDVIVGYYCPAD